MSTASKKREDCTIYSQVGWDGHIYTKIGDGVGHLYCWCLKDVKTILPLQTRKLVSGRVPLRNKRTIDDS